MGNGSIMYNIADVPYQYELKERFLFPFSQLNYLTGGGILDRITLIGSGTNNGKTTLAAQIVCAFGKDTRLVHTSVRMMRTKLKREYIGSLLRSTTLTSNLFRMFKMAEKPM